MNERKEPNITIYNADGTTLCTIAIESGSQRVCKLMESDYVELHFTLTEAVVFPVGAYYIDELFGTFYVTEPQLPEYTSSTDGYTYKLKMEAFYRVWNLKVVALTAYNISREMRQRKEMEWNLTACLKEQMREFMLNLQVLGEVAEDYDFITTDDDLLRFVDIDEDKVPTHTQSLLVTYSSTYMVDALKLLADTWECEYWVTGSRGDFLIHFGKCQTEGDSDEQTISLATNALDIKPKSNLDEYGDKLYYFGGLDNIPNTYRKNIQLYVSDITTSYGLVESFKAKVNATDTKNVDFTSEDFGNQPFKVYFEGLGVSSYNRWRTRSGWRTDGGNALTDWVKTLSEYTKRAIAYGEFVTFTMQLCMLASDGTTIEEVIEGYDTITSMLDDLYDDSRQCFLRIVARSRYHFFDATTETFPETDANTYELNHSLTQTQWSGYATDAGLSADTQTGYFRWFTYVKNNTSYKLYISADGTSSNTEGGAYLIGEVGTTDEVLSGRKDGFEMQLPNGTATMDYGHATGTREVISLWVDEYDADGKKCDYELYTPDDMTDFIDNIISADNSYVYRFKVDSGNAHEYAEWVKTMQLHAKTYDMEFSEADGTITIGSMAFTLSEDKTELVSVRYDGSTLPNSRLSLDYYIGADHYIATTSDATTVLHDYYSNDTLTEETVTLSSDSEDETSEDETDASYLTLNAESSDSYMPTQATAMYPITRHSMRSTSIRKRNDRRMEFSIPQQTVTLRIFVRCTEERAAQVAKASGTITLKVGVQVGSGMVSEATDTLPTDMAVGDTTTTATKVGFVAASKSYTTTDISIVDGGFVLAVDVTIPQTVASMAYSNYYYFNQYGYRTLVTCQLAYQNYTDKSGNKVTLFDSAADTNVTMTIFDDTPLRMTAQGYGIAELECERIKEYDNSGAEPEWTGEYVFHLLSSLSESNLTSGQMFYIVSDYDYNIPYKYFVSVFDDPSSVKTLGERRLMMPVYDEDNFSLFADGYGMTYDADTGIIYNDDKTLQYIDGYIMRAGESETIATKELVVTDDDVYPDGRMIVHSVVATDETYIEEVAGESSSDNLKWAWEQYHLQLRRPKDLENIVQFSAEYVLDSATLGVRFLVPEDMAVYAGDAGVIDDYASITQMQQQCRLSGMSFESEFHQSHVYTGTMTTETADGSETTEITNEPLKHTFTVIRNTDYGAKLPNTSLLPQVGDPVVLTGWNVRVMPSLHLVAEAEYKLLAKAFEYFKALQDGNFSFECTMSHEYCVDMSTGGYQFTLPDMGQKVCVKHKGLSEDKHTRIIGFTAKLDKPYDGLLITCGESEQYSRLKQLERMIRNAKTTSSSSSSNNSSN